MPSILIIRDIVYPIITGNDAFLVDISVRGSGGKKMIEIFIDNDKGVDSKRCAAISREISAALDKADIFPHRYDLIVSSPGIDRPLKIPRQFPKNIGRRFIVRCRIGNVDENVEGVLTESTDSHIILTMDDNSVRRIGFKDILEARVCAIW